MRSTTRPARSSSCTCDTPPKNGRNFPTASAPRPLLSRRIPWPPDKPGRVAEALDHHRGQVLGFVRHAGAGTHGVAVLMRKLRRLLASLQRAGAIHQQFAKVQNAEIGRAKMFAGAVG